MKTVSSITIKERSETFDPTEIWQDRVGLTVHQTFRDRILPALERVQGIPRECYESAPLKDIASWRTPYPRRLQNERIARYEPTSQEMFQRLQGLRSGLGSLLTRWEHLAMLMHLQADGQQAGLLAVSDSRATFCFMQGKDQEVFLVRVCRIPQAWFVRAWSFEERTDRGWNTRNFILLPAAP